MCGRYALRSPLARLLRAFGATSDLELTPRYNVAPTQAVPVVREREGARRIEQVRWGLVPRWSKAVNEGPLLLNARAETAADKPAFRDALRRRRCLVPADGFYEWEKQGRAKLPLFFHPPGEEDVLGLAGLWERWRGPEGQRLESCTILTTAANALVAPYHDRMPVVIAPEDYARWLDPTLQEPESVTDLLAPPPEGALVATPLEPFVNDVRRDGPECLAPRATLFGA